MKAATILCPIFGLLLAGHLVAQTTGESASTPKPATGAGGAVSSTDPADKTQSRPRLFASEDDFRKALFFVWSKSPDSDGIQEITFSNRTWFFTGLFWKGSCHRLRIFARPPLAPNDKDGMDDLNIQKLEMSGDMDRFIQAVLKANQGDSTWKSDESSPVAKAKGVWEWQRADGKARARYNKGSMELWSTEFAEVQRKNFEQHFLGGF